MAIKGFCLKSDSESYKKPENGITFNNAWVIKKKVMGQHKPVSKTFVSSTTVSELMQNCKESNMHFDWRPNSNVWSSFKLSDLFENGSPEKRQVDEGERILMRCCPALEKFYMRASIHFRFLNKVEDGIPFCTWCGSQSYHKTKCSNCGIQVRLLNRNGISCYESFTKEENDKIEVCQAQSYQYTEAHVKGEYLKDIIARMQKIQHHAVESSKSCDPETFEDEMRKCILAFAKAKGIVHSENTVDSSESMQCIPFSNNSIQHFSVILFEEYSRLRENFCVNYVINNTSVNKANRNTIRVYNVVDSGGKIDLHGQLTYRKDTRVSYKAQEGSSSFSSATPHIMINSTAENVNKCFVGKSGALVLFTESKITREVEISIAFPGSTFASLQIKFMPDITTYLDGTSQLIGMVYKMKKADGGVDWNQQKVIVYSYLCNTSQFQQYDLILHGMNRKWAVGDIIQMQFIPSAQKLTALDRQRIFHVWDWQSSQVEWQIEFDQEFDTYSFSPDGECLFFFRLENDRNIIINLAKVELLKGLCKLSDTYTDFSNKHVLHSPCPLTQSYSVDIIAVSKDEVIMTMYSEDTLVLQNACLQMDQKKLRYLESCPSENSEKLQHISSGAAVC